MNDNDQLIRQRDVIDIEAIHRELQRASDDIPRMTAHYVNAVTPDDPHIFHALFTAKSLIDLASQQLSHARLWLLPDDEGDAEP